MKASTETLKIACGNCGQKFVHRGHLWGHAISCDPAAKPALFWSKVEKRDGDQCWGWSGHVRWDGYGRFRHLRRAVFAHRYSYELHHGPIPAGMHVMHKCDTPSCTNPAHLRLGTHNENMADMARKGRAYRGGGKPRAVL